jgi:SAM-dependent methyltransferase
MKLLLGKVEKLSIDSVSVNFRAHDLPDELVNFNEHESSNTNVYDRFYQETNPLKQLRIFQYKKLIAQSHSFFHNGDLHLDVGCGDGLFIETIQKTVKHTSSFGIDPYTPSVSDSIQRISLTNLAERNSSHFDFITLLDVFEHFPDSQIAIKNLKTLLKPSGIILIKVPSKDSLIYTALRLLSYLCPPVAKIGLRILYQVNFPPPHYFYFNYASLDRLLKMENLEIVSHLFVSETTIPYLYRRLWNINPILKPLVFVILSILELFTPPSFRDSLAVWVKIKN